MLPLVFGARGAFAFLHRGAHLRVVGLVDPGLGLAVLLHVVAPDEGEDDIPLAEVR